MIQGIGAIADSDLQHMVKCVNIRVILDHVLVHDEYIQTTFHNGCNCSSMLGLELIYVGKNRSCPTVHGRETRCELDDTVQSMRVKSSLI